MRRGRLHLMKNDQIASRGVSFAGKPVARERTSPGKSDTRSASEDEQSIVRPRHRGVRLPCSPSNHGCNSSKTSGHKEWQSSPSCDRDTRRTSASDLASRKPPPHPRTQIRSRQMSQGFPSPSSEQTARSASQGTGIAWTST